MQSLIHRGSNSSQGSCTAGCWLLNVVSCRQCILQFCQNLSKLAVNAGRPAQPTSRPSKSPAPTALRMGGVPLSESSVLPGMLIRHRPDGQHLQAQGQTVWDSKCKIVRRSSARLTRACGARGKFGCWSTFPSLCSSNMQGCGCHSRRLGFQGSRSAGAKLQQRLACGERAVPSKDRHDQHE